MSTLDISKIDKNFASEEIQYEGLKIYNVRDSLFKIFGLYKPYEDERFKRMPHDEAMKMNPSIQELYTHTSGGRVRFKTNSSRIFLRAIMPQIVCSDHMPKTGGSCFDLYVDGEYYNTFRHGILVGLEQKDSPKNAYDSNVIIKEKKMHDILINFPLYSSVYDVFIGLDEEAVVLPAEEYTHTKPIVFYGSSITQGACASHAGNSYVNILSRRFDSDIINLGFSDGCKGEDAMAEYIAGLDMSILVYDYDHNASTLEHLTQTHERTFKIIREKQPNLPIIIITAADRTLDKPARRSVIYRTYENAIKNGDQNVYYIDGSKIYEPVGRGLCTVDQVHPNDIGFLMMANAIEAVIQKILEKY